MSVEQIKAWLLSKGVTLWASWDLSQPERLHEAAVWFKTQMYDCEKFNYPGATKFMGPMVSLYGSGWKEQAEHYGQATSWDVV